MTRGNQREQDRLKAQKKAGGKAKATTLNGQSLKNKQESDADIMRRKQEAAAAKKAADSGKSTSGKDGK
ncbi:hypothetical protein K450DRAFT_244511 [Umbelopsis ramanniana AG]|uniref:Small EDRK-rich factor-like N-terminal domain-containing protein n=1 Tax=Umbelopsis ramanniana AG TaxID=1314678 RepID=A0AAD5E7Q6_UMBRA|nr:uncharacterized protein K450DRAFT_244511 [Umbelopsis ramanniana AG]KAI8578998.1 hypothetical protein K450DRAFT_244511 [Umbelopsis ramanniana AG]